MRTKTPSFTRSDTFKFSYRILSFCLKTAHFNPARSVVMVRILHRFSENGDYQQGKKWCKWRVFDPYWTATIISGISNGNTHVHFWFQELSLWIMFPNVGRWWVISYYVMISWPQRKDFKSRHVIKWLSVAKRPRNRPIRIAFDETGSVVNTEREQSISVIWLADGRKFPLVTVLWLSPFL